MWVPKRRSMDRSSHVVPRSPPMAHVDTTLYRSPDVSGMDLGGIAWRRRVRRRYPAALLGAQLWLTVTWVPMLSPRCFHRFGGRECPVIADPGAPPILAGALVTASIGLALALAVPTRWLDSIGESVPVLADRWQDTVPSHLAATLLLLGTALLAPALFLGELRLSGFAWVAAALPVAPALLVLFGTLSVGLLVEPLVVDIPGLVALAGVIFLLLVVAVLQVGLYYAVGGLLWHAVGNALDLIGSSTPGRTDT